MDIGILGNLSLGGKCALFIVLAIGAYLLGSISAAVLISQKVLKKDVRSCGSGNAGTTNVARVFGMKAGVATLAGDFLKTLAAVLLGRLLAGDYGEVAAAVFCFIGHCWPIYFGFKGGKGVATAAAIVLFVDGRIFLVAMFVFFLMFLLTRTVSVCSISAACSLPIASLIARPGDWVYFALWAFLMVMVLYTHRMNMKRLLNKTEPKFTPKKKDT